jgi:hypothetical protein
MIQLTAPVAVALMLAFLGLVAGFGKVLLHQVEKRAEERFRAQNELREEQIATLSRSIAIERAAVVDLTTRINTIAVELPLLYVRREDWIRFGATIDHKLDRLAEMFMSLRGNDR